MKHVTRTLRAAAVGAGLIVLCAQVSAANETIDAAIGGGIGGAIGGAVGNELGGRQGAVVGAAAGAAIGAAVTTDDEKGRHEHHDGNRTIIVTEGHRHPHHGRFCPPGQAKKGNC